MARAALASVLVAGMTALSAQAPVPPAPSFEVASIRPNNVATGMTASISFDSVRLSGVTARQLLVRAYGVQPFEIIGAPEWILRDRFDVVAKAPGRTSVSEMNLMLRALLVERFKLVARVEQRESPVFFLVTAREDGQLGPSLKTTANTDCERREPTAARSPEPCRMLIGTGVLEGIGQPLYSLATALGPIVGRPVVDMTYLTGAYDFKLTHATDAAVLDGGDAAIRASSDAPGVFAALRDQLGLRLDRQSGPVNVLVIDAVERPTPD